MSETLKPYNPEAKCVKCGEDRFTNVYHRPHGKPFDPSFPCSQKRDEDHILRICINCKYDFVEAPLDREVEESPKHLPTVKCPACGYYNQNHSEETLFLCWNCGHDFSRKTKVKTNCAHQWYQKCSDCGAEQSMLGHDAKDMTIEECARIADQVADERLKTAEEMFNPKLKDQTYYHRSVALHIAEQIRLLKGKL